jgi:hypothetical protein
MESAGRTLLAAKRVVDAGEAHRVPRSLSSFHDRLG